MCTPSTTPSVATYTYASGYAALQHSAALDRHVLNALTAALVFARPQVQRLRAARARVQKYASDCKAIDPRTGETYADPGKYKRALKRLKKLQVRAHIFGRRWWRRNPCVTLCTTV